MHVAGVNWSTLAFRSAIFLAMLFSSSLKLRYHESSHAALTAYNTQMRVIFTPPWLHTRQDPNAGNSHAITDYWRGTARRCVTWCYSRGTARCRGINGEERDRAESRSWQPLVDYFATILPPTQNFLATIWPLVEIFRSLVWHQMKVNQTKISLQLDFARFSVMTMTSKRADIMNCKK